MEKRTLEIVRFELGPALTNAYLVGDSDLGEAVVIDPAWDGDLILGEAQNRGWQITHIWLTHAHFDHFGGAAAIADGLSSPVPVALHPDDHPLWRMHGGAAAFGVRNFDPGPEPTIPLSHGMKLRLGEMEFEVRHTPGHTTGHVAILARDQGILFCGDLIFMNSVGRTDFPGGDMDTLLKSIQDEVLSLPDEFHLLPGHGPVTSVGRERQSNPFLMGLK